MEIAINMIKASIHASANSFGHVVGEFEELVEQLAAAGFPQASEKVDSIFEELGGANHIEIRACYISKLKQVVAELESMPPLPVKAYECTNPLFTDVDLGSAGSVLMCLEGEKQATHELAKLIVELFSSAGYEEDGKKPGDTVMFFVVGKERIPEFYNAVNSLQ